MIQFARAYPIAPTSGQLPWGHYQVLYETSSNNSEGEKMEKEVIVKLNKNFEQAAFQQEGVEFWCARDLQELLEYTEWRNFVQVIEKAKAACHNAGQAVGDHFVDVNKMIAISVSIGPGGATFAKTKKNGKE